MPRSVLLVRHGQSTWNADGRWQGTQNPPLSPLGEAQAASAARTLHQVVGAPLIAVWTSDLDRASRTAEVLAGDAVPVMRHPGLQERCAGAWEGLTRAEVEARWPGWLDDRTKHPEGWEDEPVLLERVMTALADLHARTPEGVVVAVSHGGVQSALERANGDPRGKFANLGGVWLTLSTTNGSLDLDLGDRAELLVADDVLVTTPGQL